MPVRKTSKASASARRNSSRSSIRPNPQASYLPLFRSRFPTDGCGRRSGEWHLGEAAWNTSVLCTLADPMQTWRQPSKSRGWIGARRKPSRSPGDAVDETLMARTRSQSLRSCSTTTAAALILGFLVACAHSPSPEESLRTDNECHAAGARLWAETLNALYQKRDILQGGDDAKLSHRAHFNRKLGRCLVRVDWFPFGGVFADIYIAPDGNHLAYFNSVYADDGLVIAGVWKDGTEIEVTPRKALNHVDAVHRQAVISWFQSLMTD